MTLDPLTHERCSELLGDHAAGRLDATEAARVDAHLESCADCSAELTAAMALRAADDEPMTDLERARLRRGVAERLKEAPSAAAPLTAATGPASRRAGIATALGAAALLAIGGLVFVSLGQGGGDDEAASGITTTQGGRAAEDAAPEAGAGAGGNDADAAAPPEPRPRFDEDAGALSSDKLNLLGRRNRALARFADAYSVEDADRLRDRYVEDLAAQAEGPEEAELIRNCAESVYSSQPYAALLAYGARGRLQGREALVLGFAWTDRDAGVLDQFMLWTWPSSSCEQPIDYRAGQIAPRN